MASLTDQIEQLALRTKKAATLITMLRKENTDLQEEKDALQAEYNRLQADFNFVKTHNDELEESILKYQEQEELLTQSISSSLDALDGIEGLDDIEFIDNQTDELNAAESFTTGEALGTDSDDLTDSLDKELNDDPLAQGEPDEKTPEDDDTIPEFN